MKYITALVAFSVAFGFSVLLVGVPQRNFAFQTFRIQADTETGRQISFLLQQDEDNGRERDTNYRCASSSSTVEFSKAVNQYVRHSEAIDDAHLPTDFRYVWQTHMKAWRTQADFLRQNNLSSEKILRAEFLRTYRYQNAEINRTWFDVLEVAREYGAVIPRKAY